MIKDRIKDMGYGAFLGLVAIIIVLTFIYNLIIGNLFLSLLSMGIAVFGCYYIFKYILEEEPEPELMHNEKLILEGIGRGVALFPRRKGRIFWKKGYRDLSIYLTSRRILARSHGEFVLDISLDSIQGYKEEEKVRIKYLRVEFLENGKGEDVLLFVGDTELWMKKLKGLIKPGKDKSLSDAEEIKKLI